MNLSEPLLGISINMLHSTALVCHDTWCIPNRVYDHEEQSDEDPRVHLCVNTTIVICQILLLYVIAIYTDYNGIPILH